MKRAKTILIAVLALLVLVVVLQNRAEIETRILFVSLTMSRAVLLFGTLVIGFVLGLLIAARAGGKR